MSLSPDLVALRDTLVAKFDRRIDPDAGHAAYAATVIEYIEESDWHRPDDCPPCLAEHCDDPEDHDMGGGLSVLSDAIRHLHTQAHNDPSDSLSAERCFREPCASAGPWMHGHAPRHTFGALVGM